MQYTIPTIVSLLSVLAAAQFPIQDAPDCAVTCLTSAILESDCDSNDNACLCGNFNVLLDQVRACAGDDCSNEEIGALIRLSVEACAAVGEAVTPSSVPTPSDFTDLPTITSDASVTPSATETQTETETETDTDAATSATSATSVTSVTSVASATGTDGPEPSASDGADSDDGDNDGDSAASRVQAAGWAVAGAVAAVLAI